MAPDMAEIDIGVIPHRENSASEVAILEHAMNGDLAQFQAAMANYPLDFTAGPDVYHDRTALHIAALHGHAQIVRFILSSPEISPLIANAGDRFGYTPLHLAIRSNHESIVRILTLSTMLLPDVRVLAATGPQDELGDDCDGFTPLHLAATRGNLAIVRLLLNQSLRTNDTGAAAFTIHAPTWQGLTALDIAKQRKHEALVQILECLDVNWLILERQKSANSVNAILVGAALVVTVTFGCWLQPPLGIPNSDNWNSMSLQDRIREVQVGWFFICIAVAFSCSVVSLVIGTAAVIPSRGVALKREVKQLRRSVLRASIFLFGAIFFLTFAFQLSGLLVHAAVTPLGSGIRDAGTVVLLALPFVTSAYILRYVVLPKGMFRGKRWVMVVFFVVAFGLMIGIGFLGYYLMVLDMGKN